MRASLIISLALAVGLLITARPREAHACGGGGGEIMTAIIVVGGSYAATTGGMAIYDLAADDPPPAYGVVEALVHAPLTVVFAYALKDELTPSGEWDRVDGESAALLAGFTALHAALAIHGVYTAARHRPAKRAPADEPPPPRSGPPGMIRVGGVSASLVPTPVSDGRSIGAGLGLSGAF